jgi:hypothetical protein
MVLASSDLLILLYAFGAGAVGIVVLVGGLLAMLEGEDRQKLLRVLRHPIRTAFAEREPDDEE